MPSSGLVRMALPFEEEAISFQGWLCQAKTKDQGTQVAQLQIHTPSHKISPNRISNCSSYPAELKDHIFAIMIGDETAEKQLCTRRGLLMNTAGCNSTPEDNCLGLGQEQRAFPAGGMAILTKSAPDKEHRRNAQNKPLSTHQPV